jgi:hypothetical protein
LLEERRRRGEEKRGGKKESREGKRRRGEDYERDVPFPLFLSRLQISYLKTRHILRIHNLKLELNSKLN